MCKSHKKIVITHINCFLRHKESIAGLSMKGIELCTQYLHGFWEATLISTLISDFY